MIQFLESVDLPLQISMPHFQTEELGFRVRRERDTHLAGGAVLSRADRCEVAGCGIYLAAFVVPERRRVWAVEVWVVKVESRYTENINLRSSKR